MSLYLLDLTALINHVAIVYILLGAGIGIVGSRNLYEKIFTSISSRVAREGSENKR